jgi:hypothetical protein
LKTRTIRLVIFKKRGKHMSAIERSNIIHGLISRCSPKLKAVLLCLLICLFQVVHIMAQEDSAIEEDIQNALLGDSTFTSEKLEEMDINNDGQLDVADLVYFKNLPEINEVSFSIAESYTDESAGSHELLLTLSQPFTGTINYTVSGTADDTTDYDPPKGFVAVTESSSATIPITLYSDTFFEGDETISVSLLPDTDYQLGMIRTHVVTLQDNPYESTGDYLFVLGTETPGIEGDPAEQTGFPGALLARTASVSVTFTSSNIQYAILNISDSTGIGYNIVDELETIEARLVDYDGENLEIVFEYESESDSFVSDMPLTDFDDANPVTTAENRIILNNILTLTVNDFDMASDKFSADAVLEGSFSLSISGVLKEETKQFFEGVLLASMKQ